MVRSCGIQFYTKNMTFSKYYISELSARILLLLIFLYTEECEPFNRVIHPEEMWLYRNPRTDSYVTSMHLWFFIVMPLPFMPVLYHILTHRLTKSYHEDLISATLATTLLLPLNGVITNVVKLAVGRPRPDFAFRCWPVNGWPDNELVFTSFKGKYLLAKYFMFGISDFQTFKFIWTISRNIITVCVSKTETTKLDPDVRN